jgi:hypothetical protein
MGGLLVLAVREGVRLSRGEEMLGGSVDGGGGGGKCTCLDGLYLLMAWGVDGLGCGPTRIVGLCHDWLVLVPLGTGVLHNIYQMRKTVFVAKHICKEILNI